MKPINIKIMMALIEKEPGDQYVPVMLKFKENDIAAHCITGREYLVRSISAEFIHLHPEAGIY